MTLDTTIGGADADSVPVAIRRACAELALRALTEPLAPDLVNEMTTTAGRKRRRTLLIGVVEAK